MKAVKNYRDYLFFQFLSYHHLHKGNALDQDEKGGTAEITIKDVNQTNGEIHLIDKVSLPE